LVHEVDVQYALPYGVNFTTTFNAQKGVHPNASISGLNQANFTANVMRVSCSSHDQAVECASGEEFKSQNGRRLLRCSTFSISQSEQRIRLEYFNWTRRSSDNSPNPQSENLSAWCAVCSRS
jgi:hypothetical protein